MFRESMQLPEFASHERGSFRLDVLECSEHDFQTVKSMLTTLARKA